MSEPNPFRHWTQQRTCLLPPSSMAELLVIELMFFLLELLSELDVEEILAPSRDQDALEEKGYDPGC